jgi:hypothetical protein
MSSAEAPLASWRDTATITEISTRGDWATVFAD